MTRASGWSPPLSHGERLAGQAQERPRHREVVQNARSTKPEPRRRRISSYGRSNRISSVVLEPAVGAEAEVSVAVGTGKQFDLPDPRRIRIAIDHVLRLATRFGRLPLACERMDEDGRTLRCIRAIGEAPIAIPRELDG